MIIIILKAKIISRMIKKKYNEGKTKNNIRIKKQKNILINKSKNINMNKHLNKNYEISSKKI